MIKGPWPLSELMTELQTTKIFDSVDIEGELYVAPSELGFKAAFGVLAALYGSFEALLQASDGDEAALVDEIPNFYRLQADLFKGLAAVLEARERLG